jgi:cytochrome b subunit of formate dehydrogenase
VSLFTSIWSRTANVLRSHAYNDRGGVTPELVIWTAFLAGLALTVTGLFGPQILAAARNITFK